MEMKINAKLVHAVRRQRAWSQQHLADASGLSLRTVQRVEKTGQASPDSIKALAAAFGISAGDLVEVKPQGGKYRTGPLLAGTAVLGVLLSFAFLASTATAEPVMLSVLFHSGDQELADVRLLTNTGEPAEVILENGWKFSFVPTNTPERQVKIAAEIYKPVGEGAYTLVSSPALITDYRKPAGVKYEDDDGTDLRFDITPN